jgi:glutaredoxin
MPRWPDVMMLLLLLLAACDRDPLAEPPAPVKPTGAALPGFELRDETPNLLLTWVDDKGDFHVVTKIADVPAGSRQTVRVVDRAHNRGLGDTFYVADLRQRQPNGAYPVKTMPRAQWDEIGASKRKTRMEAVARELEKRPELTQRDAGATSSPVGAVVYGAEWCGACHQAVNYLKSIGIHVVMKDIDKEPEARRELSDKLSRAHVPPSSSIPIIDIGGEMLVGFDPRAIDRALRKVKARQTG